MTRGDITGLITSYVYAFGLLLIVEGMGRIFKWPQHLTRKIIHIGAGSWPLAILYFFDHWYIGVIPFATFIVLNYLFYRFRLFQQMDSEESSLGTVYFAISITVLSLLFWRTGGGRDQAPVAMAGVMAMTWGDSMAHLLGRAFGRNQYELFGHKRSWEGTAAMALFGFVAVFLTLWLLPGSVLSPESAVIGWRSAAIIALFATMVASFAEGVSPSGLDNLSVPLLTAGAVWLLMLL